MIFEVMFEEHVVQCFKVEAGADEDVLELVKEKYKAGKLVLEPGEVARKLIAVVKPDEFATEWIEF